MKYNLLVRLTSLLLLIIIINGYNNKRNVKNRPAKAGEYSSNRLYENISSLKSSIISNIYFSLIPIILFNKKKLIFSYSNFENSLLSDIIIYTVTVLIYYEIFQPYINNKLPNFL